MCHMPELLSVMFVRIIQDIGGRVLAEDPGVGFSVCLCGFFLRGTGRGI